MDSTNTPTDGPDEVRENSDAPLGATAPADAWTAPAADSHEQGVPGPTPPSRRLFGTRPRTSAIVGGVAALCLGFGGGGVALGAAVAGSAISRTAPAEHGPFGKFGRPGNGNRDRPGGSTGDRSGSTGDPGGSAGNQGSAGSTGSGTTGDGTSAAATATQKSGVVTIASNLYYSTSAEAAGTGIVLTASGKILTNNHVVEGATAIAVTVESTGKTYTAKVLGTDSVDDIAVLQLVGAAGLTATTTDGASPVRAGATATSIGNAGGTGNLVAATGTVTATNQNITVSDESTETGKKLSGLIEVSADVVSGDSGAPLRESDGDVVGIVTAASAGSSRVTGYAIPIATALRVARQIESGTGSATVRIGATPFLGVELGRAFSPNGVAISGVTAGKPAAAAGLEAGDVITSVNGTTVADPTALSAVIKRHEVGDRVSIDYLDAAGSRQTATVVLAAGPAA